MMRFMLKNLGTRIRKLRKEKGLTLVEISKKTGIAQATLSRIETCMMMGTVESHEKIAEALGIGLAELYNGVDRRYEEILHLKKDQERKVAHHTSHTRVELLTPESSKKKITPLLITLSGDSKTSTESNERGVEKFFYVLNGSVKVLVDQKEYPLEEGETLYFDASLPHSIVNSQRVTAKILAAVSPSKL